MILIVYNKVFKLVLSFFIQGTGPNGVGASGGIGYGAGGGGGGCWTGSMMFAGGNGTNGLVYIEWD